MRNVQPKHRSFWLQEVAGDAPDAPSLWGSIKTDIAVIGGGYVGLWTAIRIKELAPGCNVTILEQDVCGGGASGRNGGFVLSWLPKLSSLAKLFGIEKAIQIVQDSEGAISEISEFCRDHQIDADFRRGGWLWTATSAAQTGAWESVLRLSKQYCGSAIQRVDSNQVAFRAGSAIHRAGVFIANAAVVQPAALVRGLRRVALQMGVSIFENTPVVRFSRTVPATLRTPEGSVTAEKVVIATNAWSANIRELSRSITVISSDMIVTAPAAQELERIGWHRDLSITDSQTMVDYYRITRDGRVAFGKGGWTIAYAGNIGANFDRQSQRALEVTSDFRRYYPQLDHVPITHDWSGPIDRTPDSLPLLGHLGRNWNVCYGIGWSGNGVGPSVIGGRILASLALDRQDRWSQYPLVSRVAARFPPEPIRFLGAHVVRTAVARKEKAEMQGRRPSRLAALLSRLAPKGLEDK